MGAACTGAGCGGVDTAAQEPRDFVLINDGFYGKYILEDTIGSGNYSVVRCAVNKQSQKRVAVKVVTKAGMLAYDMSNLRQEAELLKLHNHPSIIKCLDFYEDASNFFIVLEYMEGGDLLKRIKQLKKYDEISARAIMRSLLEAIKHLHGNNIIHRDLKPDNILLVSQDNDVEIKLADFGYASLNGQGLTVHLGTPAYIAPEITRCDPYDRAVDMWAAGCIAHYLLAGQVPFKEKNQSLLNKSICKCEVDYSKESLAGVSNEAKKFMAELLCVNPEHRLTADQALCHPWFKLSEDKIKSYAQINQSTETVMTVSGKDIDNLVSPLESEGKEDVQSDELRKSEVTN